MVSRYYCFPLYIVLVFIPLKNDASKFYCIFHTVKHYHTLVDEEPVFDRTFAVSTDSTFPQFAVSTFLQLSCVLSHCLIIVP